jgi:hypothetical protein
VALPFIALSTTAVVAQIWIANSQVRGNREPYPLYAASNAGSLLALLGYAFLIEPFSGLRVQTFFWSGAYVVYVLLVLVTWCRIRPGKEYQENSEVIPLALYLGSFIVTFRTGGGVPRFLKVFWLELLLVAFLLYLLGPSHWLLIAGLSYVFFVICLVAHGTLYELRPAARYLTNFYLASGLGGLLGGAFVSLVAPVIFSGLFEYPIALILFAALFWWHHDSAFIAFWRKASRLAAWGRLFALAMIVFPIISSVRTSFIEPAKFQHRNFYGAYSVKDGRRGDVRAERALLIPTPSIIPFL